MFKNAFALTPCDFCLFQKLKYALKGIFFEIVNKVEEKLAALLKRLTHDDLFPPVEKSYATMYRWGREVY